ncbi:Catechol 2,3-dioxygenase [Jatrophihabitans endophyticus]|uniref:Catechol 2,3-dioxygenase n=1 Tax=Jatrophihabitans endophyticus TaxID=1206085 RepID=A0A1M5H8T7_9ACTN|nr:VOC family protein [Jatrophihabitans endophyticus]SHG12152.1 Catechol 2,3-dioxygenase [Jatrophihabitans endophyticus]
MTAEPIARPAGFSHVRLTVTDIHRSKAFYEQLLGTGTVFDYSDRVDEPGVRDDPDQLYGGCGFALGDQLLGLRPAATAGDTFDSTRVGLDHLSLSVGSVDDLHSAAGRLTAAGVEHGEVKDLGSLGMTILSVQDPDDINVELSAPNG